MVEDAWRNPAIVRLRGTWIPLRFIQATTTTSPACQVEPAADRNLASMVSFRRNYLAGGTYFFTVTLRDRQSRMLTDHVGLLRAAFREAIKRRPFAIDAVVILPEHLHALMRMPEGDADYSGRWRAIKASFSRSLAKAGIPLTQDRRGEYRLWQRRFWEHTIRDEEDLQRHIDYIHFNPVKHGWVNRAADWPYSSFHRFVRMGWLDAAWGTELGAFDGKELGE